MNYGSDEDFVSYITSRGRDIPGTWDDGAIDAALLVASEWIDNVYGSSFAGYKTGGFAQEREWPRAGAYTNSYPSHVFADSDIPTRVAHATYEAAYRQLTLPGSLQVDYKPNKYKRVSVDGAISVEYAQFSSSADVQSKFSVIESLMAPLLTATGANLSPLSGGTSRS